MWVKKGEAKNIYDHRFYLLFPILLSAAFIQCNKPVKNVHRAFYHWKSTVKLTSREMQALDSLHVNTLYVKLFDVDWDEATHQPIPAAKLSTTSKPQLSKYQIIPVVFITNECLLRIDSSQANTLANKIHKLIKDLCMLNQIDSIMEIQIDCDWTASTREKYFSILQSIKRLNTGITLSATIRLHQVKFVSKSGVPPIDKGLLMCYNMGNLKNAATKNSIIETKELKKYIGNLQYYPLPLDVALPLFEWKVLFRNNVYMGLIEALPDKTLTPSFCRQIANRTELLKDTLLQGYELKKGDVLRSEKSNIEDVLATAREINIQLKNTEVSVSLYHLDSVTLNKYTTHELESIYRSFH
ncbi:MAG: hypothetical protein ABIN67_19860 [Ferruginibacter sp.]